MKNLPSFKIIFSVLFVVLISGISFMWYFINPQGQKSGNNVVLTESKNIISVPTEIASSGDVKSLSSTGTSWPGDIVSYTDAEITPSREGQIAELYVNIGSAVQAGEVIGRMNQPPASLELTSLLAEKKQTLIVAQAQAAATRRFVNTSKKQLADVSSSIFRARDAALDVATKEAVQNRNSASGASKDLEALKASRDANINVSAAQLSQAETVLPMKFNTARAAAKALLQRSSGAISSNGVAPDTYEKATVFQFDPAYGLLNYTARVDYVSTLSVFARSLGDSTFLPETDASNYTQATLKLLANTAMTEQIMASNVENIRNIVFEDEQIFLEAIKDYKDAQKEVEVLRAKYGKITVDTNRDIIGAQTNVTTNEAYLNTAESMKASQIAEADKDFRKEKASLDGKTAELKRQLDIANAEVRAAGAAYKLVEAGLGEQIRATQSGVISAIYKKVGDYVTVDTPIAATSSENYRNRFVRFRIPIDMRLPERGEEVSIEQPGFPLDPKKAIISGVGLALDRDGSYQADAEFNEPVDWPVNLSVRVISSVSSNFVLVPFTAVWWDNKEIPHVWMVDEEGSITSRLVTLGRALGDRIEITEGIMDGEKYVTVTSPSLREGIVVSDTGGSSSEASSAPKESMEEAMGM